MQKATKCAVCHKIHTSFIVVDGFPVGLACYACLLVARKHDKKKGKKQHA